MAYISTESQNQLAREIQLEFGHLAEFLMNEPEAYTALHKLNKKFTEYSDNSRLLLTAPKENQPL